MSGTVPTYDDNGNLTSYGARNYIYSAENQLLQATTLSGGTVEYSYGPGARRVRKNVDGTVTSFIHAGGMEIAEYDGSGNVLRRYIPGPGVDQRIAMIDCGTSANCAANETGTDTQYYFADRLGNVLAVTDNTGDIVQQFFYTPFGVEMVGQETGNPFRYTGRKYDPETGLYYYRARYYDADLGRFLQVDPIGYEDQWNLYSYVGNNPLNATDPTGRATVPPDATTPEYQRREIERQQAAIAACVAEPGMCGVLGVGAVVAPLTVLVCVSGACEALAIMALEFAAGESLGPAGVAGLGYISASGARVALKVGDTLLAGADDATRAGMDVMTVTVRGTGDTLRVSVDMLESAGGSPLSRRQLFTLIDQLKIAAGEGGSRSLEIRWIAGGSPGVERVGNRIAQSQGGTYRVADDGVTQIMTLPVGD